MSACQSKTGSPGEHFDHGILATKCIDVASRSKTRTGSCSFYFSEGFADVDVVPYSVVQDDSFWFNIETWSIQDFEDHKAKFAVYCGQDKLDSCLKGFQSSQVFGTLDSAQVEIHQEYVLGKISRDIIVVHGATGTCVLSYQDL